MNAAQAGAIIATFTYVSDLLAEVLSVARGDVTLFDRQRRDVSPEEAALLEDVVPKIRRHMLKALASLGIPEPKPDGSAHWSVRTSLFYADVALSELTDSRLLLAPPTSAALSARRPRGPARMAALRHRAVPNTAALLCRRL